MDNSSTFPENPAYFISTKASSREEEEVPEDYNLFNFYIGVLLSLAASFFSGASFAIKKRGLLRVSVKNKHPASGSYKHGYLKDWVWWLGTSLMAVGEMGHFSAFYFAPATVVTTLQILTVLVTAVTSSRILGEKVNRFGKLACALCVSGCCVIVFFAPSERSVSSMDKLATMMQDAGFLSYIIIVIAIIASMMCYCIPQFGHSNSLVFTFVCALLGSLIMISIKSIALAIQDLLNGSTRSLHHWLTWVSILTMIICLLIQMEYINRALDLFNTLVVTTQYYVIYSASVIVASSLLFKEWQSLSVENIFVNINGFLVIVWGVFLFSIFKEENASFDLWILLTGTESNAKLDLVYPEAKKLESGYTA